MRKPNLHPRYLALLVVVLVTRCVLDLYFAWRIDRIPDPSPIDLADIFAPFGLIDGIASFAIAIVGFAVWLPRGIIVIAATDGVLKIAAATALHFGPGIPYFPMTIVLYVGLLAAFALAFGVAETVAARQIERMEGWSVLSVALAIAGASTVALALAQFGMLHVPNALKNFLTIGIALQALTMLAIAIGALAGRTVVSAASSGGHAGAPR